MAEMKNYPTRYFVDQDGKYLGGYSGPNKGNPHKGAVEVPHAPRDARQVWLDDAWSAPPAPLVIKTRSEKILDLLIAKSGVTEKELDAALKEDALR